MIPKVRAAFSAALDQVNRTIVSLNRGGYLPEPWLGDEVSSEVAAHYTRRAMDAPDSSYQALVAYHAELRRVHDTLKQMEDDYHRNEGEDATRWGRMA
jgi:hypothetical protein